MNERTNGNTPGKPSTTQEPIAIIGMGCRYPDARGLRAFWRLLREGRDAISEIPSSRWDVDEFYDPDIRAPGKMQTRWGGFLDDIDRFDARFFNISPREADHLDPQQRQLLEVTWEALEHGGQTLESISGSQSGVFIATLGHDYDEYIFDDYSCIDAYVGTGNAHSLAANRLSYVFDLRGPSVALDTACSGSLVALHMACQSLRSGECALAIAGGVNAILLPKTNIFFTKAGAIAPDGRCKAFDAGANGIVRSEGVGVVVLKRLSDALAAGDPIQALILGSSVNSDGNSDGLMAPNQEAQKALLRDAYRRANVAPEEIQFVEAHGTGTPLGDATEINALNAVLGANGAGDRFCAIGSVKSNIGHTEAAAGVAGVIKVALAMQQRQLPPSLHVQTLNPALEQPQSHVRVQTELGPWPAPRAPLLAGVSAFGIGGTNAHIVMAEHAPADTGGGRPTEQKMRLLLISARTEPALRDLADAYRRFLTDTDPADFADVCYTAAVRRTHHPHRLALVASTPAEAAEQLRLFVEGEPGADVTVGQKPWDADYKLAFVFSGQGSHWLGMGRELLRQEPVFREKLEACATLIGDMAGWSLFEELQAGPERSRLNDTDVTQPAIFALQVALAALWRSWGVEPDVVVGHSLGEVAAAHVAGALSLADAVRIVVHRSCLMQRVAGQGRTAVVGLSMDRAQLALANNEAYLSVAGSNSATSTVLSGDPERLQQVLQFLEEKNVFCRMLKGIDIAFHSPQMDPLREELVEALGDVHASGAQIPIFSTVTGQRHDGSDLTAAYWGRNLREPFIFSATLQEMLRQDVNTFLEVSPHPVLSVPIQEGMERAGSDGHVLDSLHRDGNGRADMLKTVGDLYALGWPVAEQLFEREQKRVVPLPEYAWQGEQYWYYGDRVRPARRRSSGAARWDGHPMLGRPLTLAVAPSTRVWESAFSTVSPASMGDHRVHGTAVVPGAVYVELALAAAAEMDLENVTLEDVTFEQAFFLPEEGTRKVQVVVTPDGTNVSSFQIFSLLPEEPNRPPQLHAQGRIRHGDGAAGGRTDLAAIKKRCPDHIPGTVHYQRMSELLGLHYGTAYKAVQEIWRRDGEVLSTLDLPASLAGEASRCLVHPSLLDAAFQVVTATLPMHEGSGTGDNTFLPVRLGRVRQLARPGRQVWVHAVLHSAVDLKAQSHRADVFLLNEDGETVAEIRDLLLLPLTGRYPGQQSPAEWAYELVWQPEPGQPPERPPEGSWLIVDDNAGHGAVLAGELEAAGVRVRVIAGDEAIEPSRVDPAGEPGESWDGLVYLRGLDASLSAEHSPQALETVQMRVLGDLLRCVQFLSGDGKGGAPQLWIATAGAQAVVDGDAADPGQAGLWGLGRVLLREHTELQARLVDLDPESEIASTLGEVLRAPGAEEHLALRSGERFVCRLRAAQIDPQQRNWRWRPDGAYLITGGLGALGLAVARHMVEQGARRLILMGRTALPERAQWRGVKAEDRFAPAIAAIREMEALGATVRTVAVDVTEEKQLAAFLEQYRREDRPPIRGVIHAAGVLHDELLTSLQPADLRKVLRPKVLGAWNLHRHLQNEQLDIFVMFSSIAAVLGSIGQGNYAAGNAFMDGLAHYRRAHGLPALSINWGPWAESGMAARQEVNERLASNGIDAFTPAQGQQLFGLLLNQRGAQYLALNARWERWPQADGISLVADLLASAVAGHDQPPSESAAAARQDLLALTREEQRAYLEEYLQELVARVFRLELQHVDPAQPLNLLGLDSIMALEIKTSLHDEVGVALPLVAILRGPSIAQLVAQILEELLPDNVEDDLERLLAEVEEISIDEAREQVEFEEL